MKAEFLMIIRNDFGELVLSSKHSLIFSRKAEQKKFVNVVAKFSTINEEKRAI